MDLFRRMFGRKKEKLSEGQLWQKKVDIEFQEIDNTIESLEEEIKEKSVKDPKDTWKKIDENRWDQEYNNKWKQPQDKADKLSNKLQELDNEAKKIVLKKDNEICNYINILIEKQLKSNLLIDSNFYEGKGYEDDYIEKLSKTEDNKLKKLKQLAKERKQLSDKREKIKSRIEKTKDFEKKIEEQLGPYSLELTLKTFGSKENKQAEKQSNKKETTNKQFSRQQTNKNQEKRQQKKKKQQNSRIDSSTSSSLKNMNSKTNNIAGSNQKSTFKQIKQQGGEKMESSSVEDYITLEVKKTPEKTREIKVHNDSSTSLSSDSETNNIPDFEYNQVIESKLYQREKQEVNFSQSLVNSQEQTKKQDKTPIRRQQNQQNSDYSDYYSEELSSQTPTKRQNQSTSSEISTKQRQNQQGSNRHYSMRTLSLQKQTRNQYKKTPTNQRNNESSRHQSDNSWGSTSSETPTRQQRNKSTNLSSFLPAISEPLSMVNLSTYSKNYKKTPVKSNNQKNKEIKELGKRISNIESMLKQLVNQQTPQNQQTQLQQQTKQNQTPSATTTPTINNKLSNSALTTLPSEVPTTKTSQNQQTPRKKPMTWNEVINNSDDFIGFIENVIKYVKENFGGDYEKFKADYKTNYDSKYKNADDNDKNKFVEKLGGIDKVTEIAKGDKTPRQLAEETLKFEMVNYLVDQKGGNLNIEEAKKMTENVKFDKQPLKQYTKNLETIYKKKEKIQKEGNIPLTLDKIAKALEQGVEENSIGLKRRFITEKTKESARGINNLVMGAINSEVENGNYSSKNFNNLTSEEKSTVLNKSLKKFDIGEGVTTNSILASDQRAADLVMQGLKNVKNLIKQNAKDEEVLKECNNQIKNQIENAQNAINEKSARCASEYYKKERDKVTGFESEQVKERMDLQSKFDKFKGKEGELKKSINRVDNFLKPFLNTVDKDAIRRKNVDKDKLITNNIVANLNFEEIEERIKSKSKGVEDQFKTNREKQRKNSKNSKTIIFS